MINYQQQKRQSKSSTYKQDVLVGLDLGQQNDYTVLSVLMVGKQGIFQQKTSSLYSLSYLKRVPLNVPYPKVVNWVSDLTHNHFNKYNYRCVVDYTGVGRPIVDMLRERNVHVIAVNTTGGTFTSWKSSTEVSVPKRDIVTALKVTLESYRLIFVDNLPTSNDIVKEFINFTEKKTEFANLQYEAKYGYHDDIVMSIGLAVWYGEHKSVKKRKMKIISWE